MAQRLIDIAHLAVLLAVGLLLWLVDA